MDGPTSRVTISALAEGETLIYIARHGPFVMNTREELMQAFVDFQQGRF